MSDITIIGLGLMGTALAKTLLKTGRKVTVWNRSPKKAADLIVDGAIDAATIEQAVAASPIILVCVKDYAVSALIFEADEVQALLADRIVLQLSTGTPQDATTSEAWFKQRGASYLDGAILGSPKAIGTEEGHIIVAGAETAWQTCKPVIEPLAWNLQHVGIKSDAAALLDLAWLCQRLGLFMGVFQGLLLCEAGGVGADVFGDTVAADSRVKLLANTIHNNSFDDPTNTVIVWSDAFQHILSQARKSGANSEVLDFIADKFERALAAGYAEQDVAALIKIFGDQ